MFSWLLIPVNIINIFNKKKTHKTIINKQNINTKLIIIKYKRQFYLTKYNLKQIKINDARDSRILGEKHVRYVPIK